jgi:putative endonuclease
MQALFRRFLRVFGVGSRGVARELGARPATADAVGLGLAGERAAEAHLRAQGLRVLARNWRNPEDAREEIDLVCEEPPPRQAGGGEQPVLVFVEVKARVAGARVGGYQSVDRRKKAVLLRACRAYLKRLRPPPRHYRFDIVEIVHGAGPGAAAALEAMRLDPGLASQQEGRQVWHYRDVPLFPPRSSHRHG